MKRILISLLLITILAACNLTNSSAPAEVVIAVTEVSTSTATPTAAALITNTPVPTTVSTTNNDCPVPDGWVPYTVQRGDTLFSIAQRSQSSVVQLETVNCLVSPDTLEVGQILYVPRPLTANPSGNKIVYWLPSDNAVNDESLRIGCETYITPIETSAETTDDPASDIRTALTAMFNVTPREPYRNHWDEFGLSVESVSISNDKVTITIDGDFLLVGTCGDAEIIAQLLLTVFENPTLQSAFIVVNDDNFRQWSDMSGLSGPNAVFTRASIPLLDN